MEQGASDIKFKQNNTEQQRMEIFKNLFQNDPIYFIETFTQFVDDATKKRYIALDVNPRGFQKKLRK